MGRVNTDSVCAPNTTVFLILTTACSVLPVPYLYLHDISETCEYCKDGY